MVDAILINLIRNAIKFSEKRTNITLSAIEKDVVVELSIKDEGIGMSPEQSSKLFKGNKVKSSKGTDNESGHGLGLSICQKYVEALGGEIWVESEEGKGSTFKFTLPKPKLLENESPILRVGNALITKDTKETFEHTQGLFKHLKEKDISLNLLTKKDFTLLCSLGKVLETMKYLEKGKNELLKMDEKDKSKKNDDEAIFTLQEERQNATIEAYKLLERFVESKTAQ